MSKPRKKRMPPVTAADVQTVVLKALVDEFEYRTIDSATIVQGLIGALAHTYLVKKGLK